jgi:hypothetical protein
MTLRAWQYSSPARTELTRAVFPVPGYEEKQLELIVGMAGVFPCPAMAMEPFQVDLSNART